MRGRERELPRGGWKRIIRDHVPAVNWSIFFADSAVLISASQQKKLPRSVMVLKNHNGCR